MSNIQLSDHFTYRRLLRFSLPSVIMMIFTSLYGVVDGIFVSNYTGKTAFAAVNLIYPVLMLLGAVGFMIGTGGSALVAKLLGEGKKFKANRIFSMLIYTSVVWGILTFAAGFLCMRPIAIWLGAEGDLIADCVIYGRILILFMVPYILQCVFQSFLVVAQKPQFGLWITVAAGVTNIAFDALFVVVFQWGLIGAAVATGLSQLVGGAIPLAYFFLVKKSTLRLGKCGFYPKALCKACVNGSSEMLTNISMSLVNILYNVQLMRFAGENGVAAYGVMMYINFVFLSAFIGYSLGSAPIISFHYGAKNHLELQNLFRKSMLLLGVASLAMFLVAELSASWLSAVFVGYDGFLYELTTRGCMIFSVSFLVAGINIFSSAFFTALNNGLVSAILSFLRTLVFQVIAVLCLPIIFRLDGIWAAVIAAEGMAFIVSLFFLIKMKKRYCY